MRQKAIFILYLLAFQASLFASVKVDTSKADAVYDYINYAWSEEGNGYEEVYSSRVQLITPRSMNRLLGESFIIYNPRYQELKIERSETIMRDGRKIPSPLNAFNELLPSQAQDALQYHYLREMVVTHTGLELGAEILFDYSLSTQNDFLPGLTGKVLFGSHYPVKKMSVTVEMTEGGNLVTHLAGGTVQNVQISESSEGNTFSWSAENIALIEQESDQPPLTDMVPVLYFSTMTEKEVLDHLLQNQNELYTLPIEAVNKAEELIGEETNPIKQALTLRKFVQHNVGASSLDLSTIGWRIQTAAETWDYNSGTQLDRAVLLAAMLKAVNIFAVPVLVSESPDAEENIALLSQFTRAMVRCGGILREGEILMLDPDHEQNSLCPDKIMHHVYFALKEKSEALRYKEKEHLFSKYDYNFQFVIDTDGNVKGSGEATAEGNNVPVFDEENFGNIIVSALKKKHFDISNSTTEDFFQFAQTSGTEMEYESTEPITYYADKLYRFELPVFPNPLNSVDYLLDSKNRTTPCVLEEITEQEHQYNITIPNSMIWLGTAKRIQVSNKVGDLFLEISNNQTYLTLTKKLKLHKRIIPPDESDAFNELLQVWRDNDYNHFYFKKR